MMYYKDVEFQLAGQETVRLLPREGESPQTDVVVGALRNKLIAANRRAVELKQFCLFFYFIQLQDELEIKDDDVETDNEETMSKVLSPRKTLQRHLVSSIKKVKKALFINCNCTPSALCQVS